MILSIVLAVIGLLMAAYFLGKKVQRNQLADVIWTRNYWEDRVRVKSTSLTPGHVLVSFDKGVHWYTAERPDDGFVILGTAEEIYPGVLEQINGFKAMAENARKYGSLPYKESRYVPDRKIKTA